ncbi:MAG: 5'-methylthioadenosine/adenosylhomocysteine nucleosidase [Chitinophagaceae bacterium]
MLNKGRPFLLLSAMQQEHDAVVQNMSEHQQYEKYGITIVEGVFLGKHCVAAMSGVGKVAAAFTSQVLMEMYAPQAVIFTGVGGALNPDYEIGDIVIARDCVQHDMDGRGLGFKRGEVPYAGLRYFNSDADLMRLAMGTECRHTIHVGRVLTGDQFITNKDQVAFAYMKEEFNGDVVDMEGAAVAFVSLKHQTPFLIVRTISDKANNDAPESFEAFLPEVVVNSSAIIKHILLNSPS